MSRAAKTVATNSSALIARMAAGDHRALGALYDAYGHVAYGLAFAITGARATAESVVSQSFAEAWQMATSFELGRASVLAWLTAIVRRKALAACSFDRGHATPEFVGGVSGSTLPRSVGEALRSLSATQRHVIELSYYRGLTIGQIAAHLGEPENGARELLRSAMHELRSALAGGAVFDDHVVTRA
jgi:RNA polymerase sigma-70 factor (ECF subfamily)